MLFRAYPLYTTTALSYSEVPTKEKKKNQCILLNQNYTFHHYTFPVILIIIFCIGYMYIYIDTFEKKITYTIRKTWRKILLVTGHRREALKSYNMDTSCLLKYFRYPIDRPRNHQRTSNFYYYNIPLWIYLDLPMAINTIFVHHRRNLQLYSDQFNST